MVEVVKFTRQQKSWLVSRSVNQGDIAALEIIRAGLRTSFTRPDSPLIIREKFPTIGFLATAYLICGGDLEALRQVAENTRRVIGLNHSRQPGQVLLKQARILMAGSGV